MIYKKLTAALLTLAMTLMILASCVANGTDDQSNDKNGDPATAEPIVLENSYVSTDIKIENTGRGYMNCVVANDRIYYMTTNEITETDEDGNVTAGYTSAIESVNSTGGDPQTIWSKEFVYPDYEQDIIEYENVTTFAADGEGNLWLVISRDRYNQSDSYSESQVILSKYAPDGTELISADISEASSDSYFYPNAILFNGDGNVVMYSNQALFVFDNETAELDFKIEEQDYIYSIASTNKGEVVYIMQSSNYMGYDIKSIDFEAKKIGSTIEYSGSLYFNTVANGNGDYSLYVVQSDYIYGLKLETMTEEVVVSFMNSDIDGSYVSSVQSVGEGDFIIANYNWDDGEMTFMSITPNPNPIIEGKVLITLGAVYLDTDTRTAIRMFNKSSDTARITVKDYSQYNTSENYNLGSERLDMDILAGNAPDIISMNQLQSAKYVTKGVLEDLLPYLESDPEIDVGDLFTNILEAGMFNDKLYHIITTFSISTLIGKKSIFGEAGNFTAGELLAIAARYPDADITTQTTAESWLYSVTALALGEFVDWTTGKCTFDSQEFIDLLSTSALFPETIDYDALYADYEAYRQNMETTFMENRTLLRNSGLNRIREVRSTREMFGEEVSYVGYPTATGGASLIYPQTDLGISATSKFKDEAWEFVKLLMSGEVTSSNSWAQSIRRDIFEANAAEEMLPITERDFEKGVEIVEVYADGGASMWTVNSINEIDLEEYADYALTQQEVDMARAAIESATKTYSSDETISTIISEEVAAFISGAKSAAEVAQIIQSRVSIYVSESM